ncbi:MAG: Fe-S cluster assembly protein SufD [Acidobacteria bacterium]|nr:MAG: Fe-S cluster assembly protein SufD [Acidobacteriota bacterium]
MARGARGVEMSAAAQAPAGRAEEVVRWREEYESYSTSLPATEPEWLRALRAAGIGAFEEIGFPTLKHEDWRHTSVAPIVRTRFARAGAGAGAADPAVLDALTFGRAFQGHQLVFVNGRHAPDLSSASMADGVHLRSLREVLDRQPQLVEPYLDRQAVGPGRPFSALNSAFLDDGAFVFVPAGKVLADPIHLVFFSAPGAAEPTVSHPRVLVRIGRNSQAAVVESYGGAVGARYLTNQVTEVVLEDGAVLDHYRMQRESLNAFHVGALCVSQGRATRFASHTVSLGAALSRVDIRQVFAGEGGECTLNGLFLGEDSQHTDTHTWVDHAQPHCSTRELYKGIVDDRARGVFVGKILVRPGAQKTDAIQTNKNLILSREALVDSLPQLEILADDVKCKHGSTTGQLDPLALFYLRSRGIGEDTARALLTYAFASDVVQRIGVEALRAGLTEYLQRRLPAAVDIQEAVV